MPSKCWGSIVLSELSNKLLAHEDNYLEFFDGNQVSKKHFGEIAEDVSRACALIAGLVEQGTQSTQIGFIGANCYEWIVLDLACIQLGVSTLHMEPDAASDIDEVVKEYGLDLVFTNIELTATTPIVRRMDEFYALDSEHVPAALHHPGGLDTITFKKTSGTTGLVKTIAVRKQHVENLLELTETMFAFNRADKILVAMHYSIFLQRFYVYMAILYGFNILLVPMTVVFTSLARYQPTIIIGVPHFFKTLRELATLKSKASMASGPGTDVLQPVFGDRVRVLLSGSAAMNPRLLAWYADCGHPIFEAYGMSEVGMISVNHPGSSKQGSVGRPLPDVDVRIDEDGVLLVKGKYATNNTYYGKYGQYNAGVYLDDGYVRTGDVGVIDDEGFIFLKGRLGDRVTLSNGKKVNPAEIESLAESCDGVEACTVFGDEKPYLVAVIHLAQDASPGGLASAIRAAFQMSNSASSIAKAHYTDRPLSKEDGTLNENGKKVRSEIYKRYESEVTGMYR